MKKKPRFLCDVDGIAADFMAEAINVVNSITNQGLTYDQLQHWEVLDYIVDEEHKKIAKNELNKAGLCERLSLYENSLDAIKELNEITNLYFITAPMTDNVGWLNERVAWLVKHFGIEVRQVGFLKDKFIVHGDFLLDDSQGNLIKWIEDPININGKALLWDRPWNKQVEDSRLTRIFKWQEVLELVKKESI
jgi:5'(3')-deoxyribonucleotidase